MNIFNNKTLNIIVYKLYIYFYFRKEYGDQLKVCRIGYTITFPT